MKHLLWLILLTPCFAQVQGSLPNVIDCSQDRTQTNSAGVIHWPENIAIGDTIVLGFTTAVGNTFTLADSLGNTFTITASTTTPAPQATSSVWMAYTTSTFAGADTITLTQTSGSGYFYMMGCRLSGLGAADGAVAAQTSTGNGGGGTGTIATSNTTTTNQDTLVSIVGVGPFGTVSLSPNDTEYPNQEGDASPPVSLMMTVKHAGAAGANTATENTYNDFAFGSHATFAMQTLAFKPTASIAIADTILPDVASGIDPKIQLHCVGGTAAQTYSLFSGTLPTGLSLNTTTGAITGTTSSTGTVSLGFRCTDGIVTSATKTLSMTVGSTYLVPNIRQSSTALSGDNGGGNVTLNALCGSVFLVILRGDDTHGGQAWTQAVNGTSNYVKDSLGSPVRRIVGPVPGNGSWPFAAVIIGPIATSGPDTITIANNQSASSGRPNNLVLEITGANLWDNGSGLSTMVSANGTFAPSFTTVVPNTLLISASDANNGIGGMSTSAPFSSISSGGDIQGLTLYASTIVSSASTVTATTTFSGLSAASAQLEGLIMPFRPALQVVGCSANFGTGEKIRRQIF